VVRDLVAEMRRAQGYVVTTAASPKEALELPDESWDLLVADVVMPEMNGVELARRLDPRRDCRAGAAQTRQIAHRAREIVASTI